jgi:hypothetical protein
VSKRKLRTGVAERSKAAVQRMGAVSGDKDALKSARRSRVDSVAGAEEARRKRIVEENKAYYQAFGRQWHTPRGFKRAAK